MRPELIHRSMSLLKDVWRAVRPRDVHLTAVVGMPDPADTGRLWGVLGPLGALVQPGDIHLHPAFDESCLRFRARARVRLIPLQLGYLTLGFLVSRPVLRAVLAR